MKTIVIEPKRILSRPDILIFKDELVSNKWKKSLFVDLEYQVMTPLRVTLARLFSSRFGNFRLSVNVIDLCASGILAQSFNIVLNINVIYP